MTMTMTTTTESRIPTIPPLERVRETQATSCSLPSHADDDDNRQQQTPHAKHQNTYVASALQPSQNFGPVTCVHRMGCVAVTFTRTFSETSFFRQKKYECPIFIHETRFFPLLRLSSTRLFTTFRPTQTCSPVLSIALKLTSRRQRDGRGDSSLVRSRRLLFRWVVVFPQAQSTDTKPVYVYVSFLSRHTCRFY